MTLQKRAFRRSRFSSQRLGSHPMVVTRFLREQPEQWDDRRPHHRSAVEEPDKLDERLGEVAWRSPSRSTVMQSVLFCPASRLNQRVPGPRPDHHGSGRRFSKLRSGSGQGGLGVRKIGTQVPYGELREILKKLILDRFAVVHRWNFADPAQSKFADRGSQGAGRAGSGLYRGGLCVTISSVPGRLR